MCKDCCLLVLDHRRNQIKCPECKQMTFTSNEGVNDLPINSSLLNIMSIQENTTAIQNISTINYSFNNDCLATLQELMISPQRTQDHNHICLIHNHPYQAYCDEDHELLCIDCIIMSDHKSHSILTLESAFRKYQSQTREAISSVEQFDFQKAFKEIESRKQIIEKAGQETAQKLDKFCEYLIGKIKKRKEFVAKQIQEKMKLELQQVDLLKQYFIDTKTQSSLAKDLILSSFHKNSGYEQLQFLSNLIIINDFLQINSDSTNDIVTKGEQIPLIGSCSIIESQFKIPDELNYYIQTYKRRLRMYMSQTNNYNTGGGYQTLTKNTTTASFTHKYMNTSLSEFRINHNSNATIIGTPQSNNKIQEQIQKTQISKQRPQSQNTNQEITKNQQQQLSKTRKGSLSKDKEVKTISSTNGGRLRYPLNAHYQYDSQKFKLSSYNTTAVVGGTQHKKSMTIIDNNNNSGCRKQKLEQFNATESFNQSAQKASFTMKKHYQTYAKHNSFLDMRKAIQSRTPKMHETSNVLQKVYQNIAQTKQIMEKRQVRSIERQNTYTQSMDMFILKSSENVSENDDDSGGRSSFCHKNLLTEQKLPKMAQSPNPQASSTLVLNVEDLGQVKKSLGSCERQGTFLSNSKTQTRKKWNIPKVQTDECEAGNTDEFDILKSIGGINSSMYNSSQINLRQVIYTPQMVKPGIASLNSNCL